MDTLAFFFLNSNKKALEINPILYHIAENTYSEPFAVQIIAEQCSIECKKICDSSNKKCDVTQFHNHATTNVLALYAAKTVVFNYLRFIHFYF